MGFPENLSQARKTRGLSQEDLAVKIGVSRQAVSKWETGDAAPDMAKLLALSDALELTLDELCGRGAEPPAPVHETPAPAQQKKARWLLPALCGFLAAALLAGGFWMWSRRDVEQASEAPAYTTLPEEFTVSGVSFSPPSTAESSDLDYRFTPSVSSDAWNYQVTFTGTDGVSEVSDAVCEGGSCSGSASLSKYDVYTVTVSISDEAGNRRNTAIAADLSFSQGRASWLPIEE